MRTIVAVSAVTVAALAITTGIALLLAGLGSGDPASDEDRLIIVSGDGSLSHLDFDRAVTQEERSAGLSGRETIPEDYGMLFVFANRGAGFWMKDTLVPLSVAFIAECGEIVAIEHMEPLSLEIHNADEEYSYGLEVAQGWFEENGIAVGDIVSIPPDLRPDHC